mmetsp:Transcript_33175/g.91422  ORF Transcript_33175/g.91422 Transcript_33175/m.91422 type:complete len:205 (+) Transcript_33175:473-1087(+)
MRGAKVPRHPRLNPQPWPWSQRRRTACAPPSPTKRPQRRPPTSATVRARPTRRGSWTRLPWQRRKPHCRAFRTRCTAGSRGTSRGKGRRAIPRRHRPGRPARASSRCRTGARMPAWQCSAPHPAGPRLRRRAKAAGAQRRRHWSPPRQQTKLQARQAGLLWLRQAATSLRWSRCRQRRCCSCGPPSAQPAKRLAGGRKLAAWTQ